MTVGELKQYIFKNEKIEFILENIGCHSIKYHPLKEYYSCANYDGDNPTAINVKNNKYLNVVNYTRKNFDENADIISLIQHNKKLSFVEAIKYLHRILGLEYKWSKIQKTPEKTSDPLDIFKRVQSKKRAFVFDTSNIKIYDDSTLDVYIPKLYIGWFREGIMPWTRKKFGIAYSYRQSRIIIPLRYWLTGELLGTNARTIHEDAELLGIPKYFITPSYPKNINLYGLYENYEAIQQAGYVVVYEAEKSVLKRDSLNDPTGVALQGHFLSDEQAKILIGLNVDIIVALDKDVPLQEVRYMCNQLSHGRNVYYMYDKWDILNEKDSPADNAKGYKYLFEHKIKFDFTEQQEFLREQGVIK